MAAIGTERLRSRSRHGISGLARKADEINRLRGQVALQNDMLAPLALPEKSGTGRPWLWPSGKAEA
jgi:hypothetical protein